MSDCIVVGGGVIGLSTALELQRAGLRVTLVEAGSVGRESSWAGGGILFPLYPWRYSPNLYPMMARGIGAFESWLDGLHKASGIDPEYLSCGMAVLDEPEFASASEWSEQVLDTAAESLDGAALAAMTRLPGGIGADAGVYLAAAAQVRNPRLVQALQQAFCHEGGQILEHCRLQSVSMTAQTGAVTGVETDHGHLDADRLVLAMGAWSSNRFGALNLDFLPVRPVRGQMLLYRTEPDALKTIVLSRDRYLIPRQDGHLLVGSTVEEVGFDKQTTAAAATDIRDFALQVLPGLSEYPLVRQWAGLRPGSPDGIPIIGEHPQHRGLYLNCGHFRNGVLFSLPSAELLRDLVLGVTPALDASMYSPQRYLKA